MVLPLTGRVDLFVDVLSILLVSYLFFIVFETFPVGALAGVVKVIRSRCYSVPLRISSFKHVHSIEFPCFGSEVTACNHH